MVLPPSDASKVAAPTVQSNRSSASAGASPDPGQGATRPPAPLGIDRSDIRPLDFFGALQILIAEVRAAMELQLLEVDSPVAALADTPPAAARDLVEWVLKSLPESSLQVSIWSDTLARVDTALESGMQSAARVIGNWQAVPAPVAAAARQVAELVANALGDELLNPCWMRPEWAGLAPRLDRLRRRRRALTRRRTDPDYRSAYFDDP